MFFFDCKGARYYGGRSASRVGLRHDGRKTNPMPRFSTALMGAGALLFFFGLRTYDGFAFWSGLIVGAAGGVLRSQRDDG